MAKHSEFIHNLRSYTYISPLHNFMLTVFPCISTLSFLRICIRAHMISLTLGDTFVSPCMHNIQLPLYKGVILVQSPQILQFLHTNGGDEIDLCIPTQSYSIT